MRYLLFILLPYCFLVASCGPPEVTLLAPISVLNWSPHDGAANVFTDFEPSVCLSAEIDPSSLDKASLRVGDVEFGEVPEERVDAEVELSPADPACIVFRQPDLEGGETYHMVLEARLKSVDGVLLDTTLSSRFRTAN